MSARAIEFLRLPGRIARSFAARGAALLVSGLLTACQPAILDPQGPIGAAEKTPAKKH